MRAHIAATCLVLLAFTWGYRGQRIVDAFETTAEERTQETAVTAEGSKQVDAAVQAPTSNSVTAPNNPVAAAQARANSATPSINETLESVIPGDQTEALAERRKEYFDGLNKQMDNLRGAPPPNSPAQQSPTGGNVYTPPGFNPQTLNRAPQEVEEEVPEEELDEGDPDLLEEDEEGDAIEEDEDLSDEDFAEEEDIDETEEDQVEE